MNRIEAKIAENDKLGQSIEELEQHFQKLLRRMKKNYIFLHKKMRA